MASPRSRRPSSRPVKASPAPDPPGPGESRESSLSGAQRQLALCEPEHLRRLEQPLRFGFADRTTARKGIEATPPGKGLEVAAGVAVADRLGSIRQTSGPAIGRHAYMAIVWLGSRWMQLENPGASAVPFTQYRLLKDFGWEKSGKPARDALKRTLSNLQEARWQGEINDAITGRKTHEDHFGIIDRVLWPVVEDGRVERIGYMFLGSWFSEQLRHEAGAYVDWAVLRDLPPIARKLYGLLENDRFEVREDDPEQEWQGYWLGSPLYTSIGSTCARERDNSAAVMRAAAAIAERDPRYVFEKDRVEDGSDWRQQLVVMRQRRPRTRNTLTLLA
jgi:hypothetical protein